MTEPTKKELNWFIPDLIKIRDDLKRTPNYTADIEYNYKDILKQKSIFGINNKAGAINKILEMLSYIKSDKVFLGGLNVDEKYLSFGVIKDDIILITGYQREILIEYLDKINGRNKKKIILKINTDKKIITRDCENKVFEYSFRKAKSKNKRFEYVIKIVQNSKIGAKELNSKSYQTTSSEIREINNALKDKLKLVENLIVNHENSGYEINNKYGITII